MLNLFTHWNRFNSTPLDWNHLLFLHGNISALLHHLGGAGFFWNFLGNFLHHFRAGSLLLFSANLLLDIATLHRRDHTRHSLPKDQSFRQTKMNWRQDCLPDVLTNFLSYVFTRLDWNTDVGALHLRYRLALLLVDLSKETTRNNPSYPLCSHTTVHFFSMISLSTGLSTMLQTFFSRQVWTGVSWQFILGTWWQLSCSKT